MTEHRSTAKPLQGVVVADFTRILSGPLCTMVLADLGADVIKVERPGIGDDTRTWGPPFVGDDAAYFLSINRNKKSIELDLGDPEDVETALQIIERSDVLVENFRSGVMTKFGLGYDDLTERNPQLVYCSIQAFLHESQRALPGYDLLMQAISGFMSVTGEAGGEPMKMGVAILDVVAGLYGAIAIVSALRDRDLKGEGSHVEVGLFEASVASLVNQAANYLAGNEVPVAAGNAHPNIVPYQAFAARDGRFVLAAANDKLFRAAAIAMNRDDLLEDPHFTSNSARVEHRGELIAEMDRTFGTGDVDEWVDAFVAAGVPAAPVRGIDEVFASLEGSSMLVDIADTQRGDLRLVRSPIRFVGVDSELPTSPPVLGADSEEIRRWIADTAPLGHTAGEATG
ncbi:MAG TPA: CoA transferase [Acidimicrobiia bacterium]|nr:CoA transferase [Acidimicrobiia bacterium]